MDDALFMSLLCSFTIIFFFIFLFNINEVPSKMRVANAYLAPCISQGFTHDYCYNEAMSILKPEGE